LPLAYNPPWFKTVRVLVLSDVHANLEALEACLAAAPAHDAVVNLGDAVGYGGSPNEVLERLRQKCHLHVRGNHDKASTGIMGVEGFNAAAALAASWTRQTLTEDNLAWLRALPNGPCTLTGVEQVQFVHGSPLDEDGYLLSVHDALNALFHVSVPITFFGHSHMQGGFTLYRESGSEIQPAIDSGDGSDCSELHLIKNARYLINPGSVGQPRDGDWRAGFALYDSDHDLVSFYRVPYDVKRAQQHILDAHLPERLAFRLSIGR
jgi:diadenosine tetraphosphatase ApaH/serine/threonine PP2A family protein phosphatase